MKTIPFSKKQIEKLEKKFKTPFYIYDEKAIRKNTKEFLEAFSWNTNFKEYFALKACPNPHI